MHLMMKGFKPGYTVWTSHGEVESDSMFNNFVVGESSRSTEHNYFQGSRMSNMVDEIAAAKEVENKRGDLKSVTAMLESFQLFSKASGLQANMSKCSIYFGGVSSIESVKIIQYTGFTAGQLPFKYLSIPLSTKKLSLMQWSPLIEKIVAKISSWTARKLSHVGRTQLIQTVLFGIQSYRSQLFIIPAKVLKLIDSHYRSFLWSGANVITKKSLVA
ncbi:uncharacterized protein LOC125828066 [Solanum verrucosum]|uniref:uncharacterized protein LOC125828066 n=1 Tax=Solanum verrucosum TaxID=315347 RepID=UPI0020D1D4A3|nr:uncharacterized protein LOC125828066 [Solanum verrucosum]